MVLGECFVYYSGCERMNVMDEANGASSVREGVVGRPFELLHLGETANGHRRRHAAQNEGR